MLSDKLKEQTATVHQDLERTLIPVIKGLANKDEYVRLLKVFYSFHKAIEDQLDKQLNDSIVPRYAQRRKASALMQDINDLEGDSTTPVYNDAPVIANAQQALGAMYVLEGSTLGGKIISRMIARNIALEDGKGLAFYGGYGVETDEMWASFKQALNKQNTDNKGEADVIKGATDTFSHFKKWVDINMPQLMAK